MSNHQKMYGICENKCLVETIPKFQGTENAGKRLSVGDDGNIGLAPSLGFSIINTITELTDCVAKGTSSFSMKTGNLKYGASHFHYADKLCFYKDLNLTSSSTTNVTLSYMNTDFLDIFRSAIVNIDELPDGVYTIEVYQGQFYNADWVKNPNWFYKDKETKVVTVSNGNFSVDTSLYGVRWSTSTEGPIVVAMNITSISS